VSKTDIFPGNIEHAKRLSCKEAILNVESVSKSIVQSSLRLNKLQILIVLSPELEARFPFFRTAKDQTQAE